MLKRIFKLFRKKKLEKGQGVVEYALILGFVAVLAAYLLSGSKLIPSIETSIDHVKSQVETFRL